MTDALKIVLGSSSIWRRKVLEDVGWDFEVVSPDIEEKAIRHTNPAELTKLIALAKADAIKSKIDYPALIITSDQVCVCNNEIREKPETKEEARAFLKSYAHYPVSTITAVVITNTRNGKQCSAVDVATVVFSTISDSDIERLIDEAGVMNASGSFIIDDPIIKPYVVSIEGDLDSVEGLPMKVVVELIKEVR